ncbi:STAS domain-containing protein [Nonomuraea sp. NPDC046570]|uniref:STAS domain-containing protein n=1 Tax=Nonomuraea sp. NPDC046570 TaxID=3155255 RepID=UPI0033D98B4C
MVVRSWQEGRSTIVEASGELDMAVAPRLRDELDRALAIAGRPLLVIDLTAVPFCDSVGLGVLVSALNRVRGAHGRLILVLGPGMIAHLLTITNLDRHFEICSSANEARALLGAAA